MLYDVQAVRSQFPSLSTGIAYFDGPGGTQVPNVVGQAIASAITRPISNRGVITESEKNSDEIVVEFRKAVADLIDADEKGIVYGPSWTQLTWNFSRILSRQWKPGDEIVVTRLDHDSNVRPWVQAANAVGVVVKWAEFDPVTTELPVSAVQAVLSPRTRYNK
jgi:selenocysteine lyase/cysteine desulfurase